MGSIPISKASMKERLRWPGHALFMKTDYQKIVVFGHPLWVKQKIGRPQRVIQEHKKVFEGNWNFIGGEGEVLNRLV